MNWWFSRRQIVQKQRFRPICFSIQVFMPNTTSDICALLHPTPPLHPTYRQTKKKHEGKKQATSSSIPATVIDAFERQSSRGIPTQTTTASCLKKRDRQGHQEEVGRRSWGFMTYALTMICKIEMKRMAYSSDPAADYYIFWKRAKHSSASTTLPSGS